MGIQLEGPELPKNFRVIRDHFLHVINTAHEEKIKSQMEGRERVYNYGPKFDKQFSRDALLAYCEYLPNEDQYMVFTFGEAQAYFFPDSGVNIDGDVVLEDHRLQSVGARYFRLGYSKFDNSPLTPLEYFLAYNLGDDPNGWTILKKDYKFNLMFRLFAKLSQINSKSFPSTSDEFHILVRSLLGNGGEPYDNEFYNCANREFFETFFTGYTAYLERCLTPMDIEHPLKSN